MLVKGAVEVCRVATHVPQQVADASSDSRLSMSQQLPQLGIGLGLCQGWIVVLVQPCQLADGQQSPYQNCWWVPAQQQPAWQLVSHIRSWYSHSTDRKSHIWHQSLIQLIYRKHVVNAFSQKVESNMHAVTSSQQVAQIDYHMLDNECSLLANC